MVLDTKNLHHIHRGLRIVPRSGQVRTFAAVRSPRRSEMITWIPVSRYRGPQPLGLVMTNELREQRYLCRSTKRAGAGCNGSLFPVVREADPLPVLADRILKLGEGREVHRSEVPTEAPRGQSKVSVHDGGCRRSLFEARVPAANSEGRCERVEGKGA